MSDLPGTPPPPPGATPPPPASPPPPPGGFGGPPPPPPGGTPPPPGGFGGPPGGFTPPPTQPYGGGGEVPRLEVGAAIGYGWKKFTENVGPFIILMIAVFVAMFVAWLLLQVVNAAFNSITRSSDSSLVLLFGFLFWALSTARAGRGSTGWARRHSRRNSGTFNVGSDRQSASLCPDNASSGCRFPHWTPSVCSAWNHLADLHCICTSDRP